MRLSALRRRAEPLVVAVPLLVALVLAGTLSPGSWGPGDDGDPGDIVRAIAADGPLGVDSSERQSPDLVGAHPVTRVGDSLEVRPAVARDSGTETADLDVSDLAVPARVLAAYRGATASIRRSDSTCRLTWPLLAGIGKVESGHAFGGAVDRTGLTLRPILGPVLDGGPGVAAITDSDDGRWDTDPTWDRAVGPMQFIPTSWQLYGADGNGDGRDDPNNVADAALASGGYLCSGERDLDVERHRRAAVFSYNHSWDYVDLVLAWADAYEGGTPVLTGDLPVLASSARTGRPPACPECSDSRRTPSNRRVALTPTATPAVATASPPPTSPGAAASEETVPPPADPTEPMVSAPAQTPPPDDAVAQPSPSPSPSCPTASESPAPSGSPSPSASPTSTASSEPAVTPTALPSASPSPTETGPTPSPTPTPSESCGSGSTG